MSCAAIIEVVSSALVVEATGSPVVIESGGAPVVLELQQSTVNVEVPSTSAIVIEVGKQGPTGPQGIPGIGDPVCPVKPDSTMTYTGEQLDRIDYADGRYKTFAYNGSGQLVTAVCQDDSIPETVTKTFAYLGSGLLSTVTTVVT